VAYRRAFYPADVTDYLRRATKAFLSGDPRQCPRRVRGHLVPIATVNTDLGQHELVEEVRGVDAKAVIARHWIPISLMEADRRGTLQESVDG